MNFGKVITFGEFYCDIIVKGNITVISDASVS